MALLSWIAQLKFSRAMDAKRAVGQERSETQVQSAEAAAAATAAGAFFFLAIC